MVDQVDAGNVDDGGVPLACVNQIAAGNDHGCAIKADRTAHCWGNNSNGEVGTGNEVGSLLAPTQLGSGFAEPLRGIAAGWEASCAITTAGKVFCWGHQDTLGTGSTVATGNPTANQVLTLDPFDVVEVSVGHRHACALTSAGGVHCWGNNPYGEVGKPAGENQLAPFEITSLSGVTDIDVAMASINTEGHSCAVDDLGIVSCWGRNSFGQLGVDPVTAATEVPSVVGALGAALRVATGETHTCAALVDKTVWCWGRNNYLQLGQDPITTETHIPQQVPGLSGIVDVDAGRFYTCALEENGQLHCWGRNNAQQLGRVTLEATEAIPGPVVTDAENTAVPVDDFVSFSTGNAHVCATRSNEFAWCWGDRGAGRLGDSAGTGNRFIQVVQNLACD
jgi:alpha-tubulin suppressor-like RCC1 family protein